MKPSIDDLEVQNKSLLQCLTLAEECLNNISQDSFCLLTENTLDNNLDVYNKVYRINQRAHEALGPLRNYCLKK
jgi:hypothetical protein